MEDQDRRDIPVLKKLSSLIKRNREHKKNYLALFGFFVFVLLYYIVLYLQADAGRTYSVTKSHYLLLPEGLTGVGGFSFSQIDDIYDWVESSILDKLWLDAECGNAICERPAEFEAFGNFGCEVDCGNSNFTSEIIAQFSTSFSVKEHFEASSWNLCLNASITLCWFEEPARFLQLVGSESHSLFVTDGNWSLSIFAPFGHVTGSVIFNGTVMWDNPNPMEAGQIIASFDSCGSEPLSSPTSICKQIAGNMTTCLFGCYANGYLIDRNSTASALFADLSSHCDYNPYALGSFQGMDCGEIQAEVSSNSTGDFSSLSCSYDSEPPNSLTRMRGLSEVDSLNFPTLEKFLIGSEKRVELLETGVISGENFTSEIWENLGGTNTGRLYNLQVATQRALYTWVNSECLVKSPKPLNSTLRLSAFFCTFFGGPANLNGCNYAVYSQNNTSGRLSDLQIYTEMKALHRKLKISVDQMRVFIDVFLQAIASITPITETVKFNMEQRLFSLQSAIVDPVQEGCPRASSYLRWKTGAQDITNISVGDILTWKWADNDPHSLQMDDGLGLGPSSVFYGMGSNRLVVSKGSICTKSIIGAFDINSQPIPCVLGANDSGVAKVEFSVYFTEPGTYSYVDGYSPHTATGIVYVGENSPPKWYGTKSLSYECSPGCQIGKIKSGNCDPECNNEDCAFDGGDCSCPVDSSGFSTCQCPSGQDKAKDNTCCESSDLGKDLFLPIPVFSWGPNISTSLSPFSSGFVSKRNLNHATIILTGIMFHQTRRATQSCKNNRFTALFPNCLEGQSADPFGVNPVFLSDSPLYVEDYAQNASLYYENYGLEPNEIHLNPQGFPYGFHAFPEGSNAFTYFIDINLDRSEAGMALQYLRDGLFLDNSTEKLVVSLITYNGLYKYFTKFEVHMDFLKGGLINAKYNIHSIRFENYKEYTYRVFQFALEVLLVLILIWNLIQELLEWYSSTKETGSLFTYLKYPDNFLDLFSLGLMALGLSLWFANSAKVAVSSTIEDRYDIYNLESQYKSRKYWDIIPPGDGLKEAMADFKKLSEYSNFESTYFTLSSITVLLLLFRFLKFMDFQPRMGTLTRTLASAAPDLFNFFLVFVLTYFGFAMFGHLTFGSTVSSFRSVYSSLITCFEGMLGNDRVNDELIQLEGWQLVTSVIYWWSFIIVMVFIVFNLLIAILVEGFLNARASSEGSPSLPEEVIWLMKNYIGRVLRGKPSDKRIVQVLDQILDKHDSEVKEGEMECKEDSPSSISEKDYLKEVLQRLKLKHEAESVVKKGKVPVLPVDVLTTALLPYVQDEQKEKLSEVGKTRNNASILQELEEQCAQMRFMLERKRSRAVGEQS